MATTHPNNSQYVILRNLARATAGLEQIPLELMKAWQHAADRAETTLLRQWRQARTEHIAEAENFQRHRVPSIPAAQKPVAEVKDPNNFMPDSHHAGPTSSH